MNDYISIISSLIIFIFPYIGRKWFNIQSLSSIAIGLGLLGTFSGINAHNGRCNNFETFRTKD